ncbi:BCCT family transporter [Nocardiopsis coralli]|uniref:BCCT family transporter n=1 Tax=Nocardiopsis coralli TaxID=2772213 RepID=UPI002E2E81F2|nr:BCCT family transporter [Nocardiopsis coralli]
MSGIAIIAFIILGVAFTDQLGPITEGIRSGIGTNLGWLYMAATTFFLVAALFLLFSRFGNIRLGPDDSRPEFSSLAWFAMLFTTGMGIGLVFFGVNEPVTHLNAPRSEELTPGEPEAVGEAFASTLFHWSFHPWAIYIALGLSLGYFAFRKGLPLRPASALYPLLGDRAFGWIGNLVDILAVFGTIFGLATSLGLGTMQINSGLNNVFGLPINGTSQTIIICVIIAVTLYSVMSGIDKGLRRLSVLNLGLAFVLMIFVFLVGPKLWMTSSMFTGAGDYLANIVPWSLSFPSPLADDVAATFAADWTLFYWGWWISWSPFVGIFLARISYGRKIREFVLGALFAPAAISVLWFGVFGGAGTYYELFDDSFAGFSDDEAEATYQLMDLLPLAPAVATIAALFLILVVTIFFITSADSGSLVVDMLTNGGDTNPVRAQRAFWAVCVGGVTLILLVLGGEDALTALQAASVSTGLPFAIVLVFMLIGLFLALSKERKPGEPKTVRAEDYRPTPRPDRR